MLYDLACARSDPIPFYGELGSLNPVVVLPGAARDHPEDIAAGYVGSLTLGTGQFCTNPGLLFVPDEPRLREALRAAVVSSHGGPMLTEKIHSGYARAVAEWLNADPRVSYVRSGTT